MSETAARDHGLRIGAKLRLPQMAQTWSEAAFRRNQWRLVMIMGAFYVGLSAFMIWTLVDDRDAAAWDDLVIVLPVFALFFGILILLSVRRARRWPDYRDQGIIIGVDGDAVTVIWQTQTFRIPYDDVRYQPLRVTIKGGVDFTGIMLTTPIGEQPLIDLWYRNGRKTAAAIIAAHDRWHMLERRG